jgi:Flp pilus assembly protein TadG
MRVAALRRDERGAVFVEKLIVYLPLLLAFFLSWELSEVAAAKLVVQRASSAAGRAAVVVLPDDPVFYEGEETDSFDGRRREDVELAAGMVLSAIPQLSSDFVVSLAGTPQKNDRLEVTVEATYECGAVALICGADGTLSLSAVTSHTYHGARYVFTSPGGLGSSSAALTSSGGSASVPKSGQSSGSAGASSGGASLGGTSQALGSKGGKDKGKGKATCSYVYRRDSRSPDEIFRSGFSAKGSNMDLGQHVEGSGQGGASGYVSTTKDERVAFKLFWQANEINYKPDWIYKIRDCGCGVDVNQTLDPCKLPPAIADKVNAYAYQEEVAIPGKINPEDIVSAVQPRKKDKPPSIVPKPDMTAEEREEFLNWPPLDQVKTKGNKVKNPRYDSKDDKRQSQCTVM